LAIADLFQIKTSPIKPVIIYQLPETGNQLKYKKPPRKEIAFL